MACRTKGVRGWVVMGRIVGRFGDEALLMGRAGSSSGGCDDVVGGRQRFRWVRSECGA